MRVEFYCASKITDSLVEIVPFTPGLAAKVVGPSQLGVEFDGPLIIDKGTINISLA